MRRQRGIALAVFVLILVALFGAFILSQTLSAPGKRLESATRMNSVFLTLQEAIVRFAQTNKRLPCPALGSLSTGVADPPGAAIDCTSSVGVLPWVSLGLPASAATDEWGRLISYRVFDGATGFTRPNGLLLDDCLDSDVTVTYPLASGACNPTTH